MGPSTNTGTLHEYLRVLSTRKWIVFGVTLVAVAIAIVYSVTRTPVYEATATIKFDNQSDQINVFAPGVQLPVDVNASQTATGNSRVITRADVVRAVKAQTNSKLTVKKLQDDTQATVQPDSDLIAITTTGDDANVSAALANAFARQTKKVVAQRSRRAYAADAAHLRRLVGKTPNKQNPLKANTVNQVVNRLTILSRVSDPVEIVRPATVPGSASSPKPARDIGLALVVGLILGIAAAFLRHALDRRLNDRHQVEELLSLPLIGYVRDETLGLSQAQQNGAGPVTEEQLEPFRIIRTNAAFMAPDQEFSSVVITSAIPEEGKSTVASWYAYVNAAAGRRTLLVDTDLRKPVVSQRFEVDSVPGLSEYLVGDADLDAVLRTLPVDAPGAPESLTVIPAGGSIYEPAEMMASQRFQNFVTEVTQSYDLVIFDSAPLLPVSDTLQLVLEVDAVLLCVRVGQTTRQQARAAKHALERLPQKPTGLVVTGVRRTEDDEYGYYGYYGYSSKKSRSKAPAS